MINPTKLKAGERIILPDKGTVLIEKIHANGTFVIVYDFPLDAPADHKRFYVTKSWHGFKEANMA